ncbi:MAG: hypothetical protein L0027_11880 [Candidatus Rokubacteria bacterium]|nr:hypothetical protein [Candidatus Rokubacteria bacterium]
MASMTQANEMFTQMSNRAVEGFTLWADTNQKILRELVDLSATTAKEGVRLYAELQSAAIEAVKDGQAYALRRQAGLQDAPQDPIAYYQKSVLETVESTQKAFRLVEGNAQAITRSAERLQVTAEQTSKEIQSAFAQMASRMKSLYTSAG